MIDAHLEAWFTGLLPAGIDRSEVVLVTAAGTPPETCPAIERSLDADHPADDAARPLLRRTVRVLRSVAAEGPRGDMPRSGDEFSGSLRPGGELRFGDGLEVRLRHYGVADFEPLDTPTALLISDDDDFSEYLRDADMAWTRGRFANHATHPSAMIANLACLGGRPDGADPLHRLFVDEDGVVRTAPTGTGLGYADEGLPVLCRRWDRLNAASTQPDAAGLGDVLSDTDRVSALAERPWISRYVTTVMALRSARGTGRNARAVSGFGGRLTAGVASGPGADPVEAPVIAQFGAIYRAIDPVDGSSVDIDQNQLRALEIALEGILGRDNSALGETCQWLAAHDVARRWCSDIQAAELLACA